MDIIGEWSQDGGRSKDAGQGQTSQSILRKIIQTLDGWSAEADGASDSVQL